jgi:hypothetical protein
LTFGWSWSLRTKSHYFQIGIVLEPPLQIMAHCSGTMSF